MQITESKYWYWRKDGPISRKKWSRTQNRSNILILFIKVGRNYVKLTSSKCSAYVILIHFTKKNSSLPVEITEIYCHMYSFFKNFVKATFLPKKILKSWFYYFSFWVTVNCVIMDMYLMINYLFVSETLALYALWSFY